MSIEVLTIGGITLDNAGTPVVCGVSCGGGKKPCWGSGGNMAGNGPV